MRVLLVDNHDSFTWNLFQMIAAITGDEPTVVRNDAARWDELGDFDRVVISPGPGTPARARDLGLSRDAVLGARVPTLGVCLGHQAIALLSGATVHHAPEPVHGRASAIFHDGSPLFDGVPQGFTAIRYHSLIVDGALPDALARIAWTADGLVMGVRHQTRPLWGVQFHPESIGSEHGARIIGNFLGVSPRARAPLSPRAPRPPREVRLTPIDTTPERALAAFAGARAAFWLDSSLAEPGGARFSFVGGGDDVVAASSVDEVARALGPRVAPAALPLPFTGGLVGYLGYGPSRHAAPYPAAQLVRVDRFVAFDHEHDRAWLVGDDDGTLARRLADAHTPAPRPAPARPPLHFRLARAPGDYLADIAQCHRWIRDGESYELCLTQELHGPPLPDPLATYLALRAINPAPHAAFLRFGELAIACSSPERFLRVDRDGTALSRPIKGTRPRGAAPADDARLRDELAASVKDRAENLMIVDLVRNDLGRVCEVGSVVAEPARVESFRTVHQLIGTVRGQLRDGLDAIDAVRAAFPAGSMTGAPKERTMALLDQLEVEARGVYAGAIGWLGGDGTCDLGVVIRTIVATPAGSTIGIGGAIVALSDPSDELDETLVKVRAPLAAIAGRALDDPAIDAAVASLRATGACTI